MKKGSSYNALEKSLRVTLLASMSYFQVDGENKRFVQILENIINDVKSGKPLVEDMPLNKQYWD